MPARGDNRDDASGGGHRGRASRSPSAQDLGRLPGMPGASFDTRFRAVECASCGAPVQGPLEGARVACGHCTATTDIPPRQDAPWRPRAGSAEEETARLFRLAAQRDHPLPGDAYDLATPPPGFTADPVRDAGSPDALRSAWNAAKPTLPAASVVKQRDALWVALHLSNIYIATGHAQHARALLETALDALSDGGHQHVVRCRLATLAVWEGDLGSAGVWLQGCDLAPEVLDLDSALREAEGRVAAASGDSKQVLAIVGETASSFPVAAGFARSLDLLRIPALSAEGAAYRAFAELTRAMASHGRTSLLADLPADDPAVQRLHLQTLEARARQRDEVPTGAAAVLGELENLPYVALAALVLVTMPRCFFDADPFGGAHGYLLCPAVCQECRGPFRVDTQWVHDGGFHSTTGPDYFCATDTNGVATLSDTELARVRGSLRRYELSVAPGALTYLTLFLLLFPVSLVSGIREHFLGKERRRALADELVPLSAAAAAPVPAPRPTPARPAAAKAGRTIGAALLLSGLLVAAELLIHPRLR